MSKSKPTPAPLPDPFASWLDRASAALDALARPAEALTLPPGIQEPEQLAKLLDLRDRLSVMDGDAHPSRTTAAQLAGRWAGDARKESLADLLELLIRGIDDAIGKAVDGGLSDGRILRSADFADLRTMVLQGTTGPHGEAIVVWAGLVNSLPLGHRLREVLPADEYYQMSGRQVDAPALVLGWPVGTANGATGAARPFYITLNVIVATKNMRERQRLKWHEEDEREAQEKRDSDKRFWASEIGQMEQRRLILERLRAKGEIPEEGTISTPAVRVGHNI